MLLTTTLSCAFDEKTNSRKMRFVCTPKNAAVALLIGKTAPLISIYFKRSHIKNHSNCSGWRFWNHTQKLGLVLRYNYVELEGPLIF